MLIYGTKHIHIFNTDISIYGANLSVTGAAIATSVSHSLAGITLVSLLLFRRTGFIRIKISNLFKFDKETMMRLIKIGSPASGERISISLGQVLFQRLIASFGTIQISAHYLATMAESVSYMPSYGFQISATSLVGQSLGAGNKEEALIYSKVNILIQFCLSFVTGILLFFFSHELIAIFTKDLEVIKLGGDALKIMALAEPCMCVGIVITGVLRGAGDTSFPFFTSIIGMWCLRLSLAWLFAYYLGYGLVGAWVAMAIDLTIRFIIYVHRYSRKKWLDLKI